MKVKVKDCVNLINALQAIKDLEVSAATAYKISRNVEMLLPVIKPYEELRMKTLQEVSPSEEGKPPSRLTPEQVSKLDAVLGPVLESDEEVNLKTVCLSDFDGVKISPAVMSGIMSIVEDK